MSATTPKLIASTIDCNDLEGMTAFWGALLGVETAVHEHFGFLAHGEDRKVTVWLQKVDEPKVGKNRVHLDLVVGDLDATLDKVRQLGGTVLDRHEWSGFLWQTCADPEGNVFDIMQAQEHHDVDAD